MSVSIPNAGNTGIFLYHFKYGPEKGLNSNTFNAVNFFGGVHFVVNKAKKPRISKRVLQENKARQIVMSIAMKK